MPSLEDILKTIGSGIQTAGRGAEQGFGAALTPIAMLLAARAGRNPMSATAGYTPPITPYQQAQIDALQSQQQYNDAITRQLNTDMGGGQQGPSRAERLLLSTDSAPGTQPQGVGGVIRGAVANAASGGSHALMPQTPPAQAQQPRRLRVAGATIGPGGKPSVRLERTGKTKIYDQGTINPETGKAFQPGEQDSEGNVAIVKPPKVTATTQSMIEAAPKVQRFVSDLRKDLDTLEKQGKVGPVQSRLNAAKTALGLPDPDWRKYSTHADLLLTLLMRMHQGARGGVAIMEHFKHLIDANRQSPENMRAALDVIEDYANDLTGGKKLVVPSEPGTFDDTSDITDQTAAAPAPSAAPGTTPSIQAARDRFRSIVSPGTVSRAAGGSVMPGQSAVVGEFGPEVIQPQAAMMVQPTPMAAMRLQAAGAPDQNQARRLVQQAQLSPDQRAGAAYTGMQGSPTTTLPPAQPGVGGYGQGVGVDQQDLMRSRSQAGSWTWDPSKGRSVFVPAAQ